MTLHKPSVVAAALLAFASGCAVGPDYQRPDAATATAFKEAEGWIAAAPSDAIDRGTWWQLFDDAELDALAQRVRVSNQNIAAAQAAYTQARALVSQQRAGLFPTIDLSGTATRADSGGNRASRVVTDANGQQSVIAGGGNINNNYRTSIGASWEPDVWGRLRRSAEAADASAAARSPTAHREAETAKAHRG